MSEIGRWLDENGLGKYAEVFAENEIDFDVLEQITLDELKELGMPLGARKRILNAVAARTAREAAVGSDAETPSRPPRPQGEAERRQLTVMFCDLVGSTELSEAMDAEDYREVLAAYQTAAAAVIREYDGYIARYMGDGLLVYFGYPSAHENDPERAARAGLDIVDALGVLGSPIRLEVRIGIATGPVVVGDIVGEGASEEAAVLGETPNLAARLQGSAAPNTVLLSPQTQELLRGAVETEPLESRQLKGLSHQVVPYRALRPRSRSEISQSRQDSAPLIGRDVELALVERAWEHARSSEGRFVLLSGEAGVGKSRLLRAFEERVGVGKCTQIQWHCSPYYQTTANYPAIEHLERSLGLTDERERGLDRLTVMVTELGLDCAALVPPLAILLSVPLGGAYPEPQWSPDELRHHLIQAQLELVRAASAQLPVLLVVEDLHWADPTTLDVLREMSTAIRAERVLMLMTARPEFNSPWLEQSHAMVQRLTNLSRAETTALVASIVEERLPSEVVAQIVERTDGVPLYVEELTKSFLESGEKAVVPASLQDSLMARLDRLGPSKELAQMASVLGRTFAGEALSSIAQQPLERVENELHALIAAGLVDRGQGDEYEFNHALVRDAAYATLLRDSRREYHARAATYLGHAGRAAPEVLGFHWVEASEFEEALPCFRAAGEQAVARGAYHEAVEHYRSGLDAARHLPERDQGAAAAELDLALLLAGCLRTTEQPDEAFAVLEQAKSEAECHDLHAELARLHHMLGNLHFPRGEGDACLAEHTKSLEYARRAGTIKEEALAFGGLGDAHYLLGNLHTASRHFMECVHIARREGYARIEVAHLGNPALNDLFFLDLEGALDKLSRAVELSRELGDPRVELLARGVIGIVLLEKSELQGASEAIGDTLSISRQIGAGRFVAFGLEVQGAIARAAGDEDTARERLHEALTQAEETGLNFTGPCILGRLQIVTEDPRRRAEYFSRGLELLSQNRRGRNFLEFYRSSTEAALHFGEWDAVEHCACMLESYAQDGPLRWADFYAARGRVLAQVGKGNTSDEVRIELQRLRDEAKQTGMLLADWALASASPRF